MCVCSWGCLSNCRAVCERVVLYYFLSAVTYPEVIGQGDQHAAVIQEAGQLAALIQLPVPGQEQRCLETHSTWTHTHTHTYGLSPEGEPHTHKLHPHVGNISEHVEE